MKTTDILSFLSLTLLAYAHAIPDPASPVTVPEATPDCSGALTVPSASEIAKAVAGCHGISANGGVRNDIIDGTCKPVTLIFARGTGEKGNIGQIVGPPFVVALEKEFGKGNVAVQGVNDYPAVVHDYCAGGSISGSQYLAWAVERTMVQCPDTKLCVSGYSQGTQVVHNALEILTGDEAATKFIDSVVTFGDPDHKLPFGDVPYDKVSVVCHKGDNICMGGSGIKLPHLTYCHNVGTEASFVKARSKE